MTYNQLQTFASANGYDWSQGRKKAQLLAFYEEFQAAECAETSIVHCPKSEPVEIEIAETRALTTVQENSENFEIAEIITVILITAIRVVRLYVKFVQTVAPYAFQAGVAARELSTYIATTYTRISYRIIHHKEHPSDTQPVIAQIPTVIALVTLAEIALAGLGTALATMAYAQGHIALNAVYNRLTAATESAKQLYLPVS